MKETYIKPISKIDEFKSVDVCTVSKIEQLHGERDEQNSLTHRVSRGRQQCRPFFLCKKIKKQSQD